MTNIDRNTKEFIQSYWAMRSKDFADLRRAELQSDKYAVWKEEIGDKLQGKPNLKILDVGCGSGFFSVLLACLGHQVTGIDITKEMIEEGRQMIGNLSNQIELKVMDAEKLEFAEESFDVVIARNVTWNLQNPKEAYKEWIRVLKKGGMLLNYDAEYAKEQISQSSSSNHAHNKLSKEEISQCNQIYQRLTISEENRPQFDVELLQELGCKEIIVDSEVGERIYTKKDEFYISAPMFCIVAKK